ncbi:MAG: Co2+/Mg2+ efflux protein ApaG [Chitinophagales bacterium]|jgi:ApaG protein|nr:Co2+/Mg2+ efflux protein ApaG [Chitinophagales bacterium]
METLITSGIEVQVETIFQPDHSSMLRNEFFFTYHITIFNHNNFTVQLVRRKWKITDSAFDVRLVEGDGVVGRQPVLYPGDSFQYVSGCNLLTSIGKMEGVYIFENKALKQEFEVTIPPFKLVAPMVLN